MEAFIDVYESNGKCKKEEERGRKSDEPYDVRGNGLQISLLPVTGQIIYGHDDTFSIKQLSDIVYILLHSVVKHQSLVCRHQHKLSRLLPR